MHTRIHATHTHTRIYVHILTCACRHPGMPSHHQERTGRSHAGATGRQMCARQDVLLYVHVHVYVYVYVHVYVSI
jgi:hypothetical protein